MKFNGYLILQDTFFNLNIFKGGKRVAPAAVVQMYKLRDFFLFRTMLLFSEIEKKTVKLGI